MEDVQTYVFVKPEVAAVAHKSKIDIFLSCLIRNCAYSLAWIISASSHSPSPNTPSIVGVVPNLAIGPDGSSSGTEEHP